MQTCLSRNPDIIRKVLDSAAEEAAPVVAEARQEEPVAEPLQKEAAAPSAPALSRGVELGRTSSFVDLAKQYDDEAPSDLHWNMFVMIVFLGITYSSLHAAGYDEANKGQARQDA